MNNHKTHDFCAYQAILALRGDWSQLVERCEKVIADPPRASGEQKYLIDHQFYLALARQDVARMEEVLHELTSPKKVKGRINDESGYTENLISKPAVIYAKMAWRHGCQVHVESPLVPAEWLSTEPLGKYENHYSFLN